MIIRLVHIFNVEDYRQGKGKDAIQTHIIVPETADQLKTFLERYNNDASLKAARVLYESLSDSAIKERGLATIDKNYRELIWKKLGHHGLVPHDWKVPSEHAL